MSLKEDCLHISNLPHLRVGQCLQWFKTFHVARKVQFTLGLKGSHLCPTHLGLAFHSTSSKHGPNMTAILNIIIADWKIF